MGGHLEIIEYLAARGARCKKKVWLLRIGEEPEIACILVKYGATGTGPLAFPGMTALHHAATFGHLELIECLLENGAELNARTKFGLQRSITNRDDISDSAIPITISVEIPEGTTPLGIAKIFGKKEAAEYLISNGATL